MNALSISNENFIITDNIVKTTSLKIAEKFGKLHKNVLRDINKLECSGEFNRLNFEPIFYDDKYGRKQTMFEVTKDGFMFLVMGFTGKSASQVKEAYINTFNEMSNLLSKASVPQTMPEALRLAADLSEKFEAQKLQITADAPKVAFHDKISVAPDALTASQAAKVANMGRNRFLSALRQIKWINRFNEPYQAILDAGYLDVKLGDWKHPDHGIKQSVTTLVKGKGLIKLSQILGFALPENFKA